MGRRSAHPRRSGSDRRHGRHRPPDLGGGLAVAATATGLRLGGRRLTLLLSVIIVASLSALASASFLGFGRDPLSRPRLPGVARMATPAGTALLTSFGSNPSLLMKTLFWNPEIKRVLVIGSESAPDGFPSTMVRLD